jgi:hypothetical protein
LNSAISSKASSMLPPLLRKQKKMQIRES